MTITSGPNFVLRWDPSRLNAALLGAFGQSLGDARREAQRRNPAPTKIGIVVPKTGPTSALIRGTGGLAHIFELGRKGGYVIQPGLKTKRTRVAGGSRFQREATGVTAGSGKVAIRFVQANRRGEPRNKGASGDYYRGPGFIGGKMSERPFMRPAGAQWAHTFYQRRAIAALRKFSTGF